MKVSLHASRIEDVRPNGLGWDAVCDDGVVGTYDEVLVATGHAPGSPYPVEHWLGRERIPSGATVAVRGFGVTFIDAALALTEGRGGSFVRLDLPFRLLYIPPDDPVGAILLFSRTGRPMLAKSGPSIAASIDTLAEIAEHWRARLTALEGPVRLRRDLLSILDGIVSASFVTAGVQPNGKPGRWLEGAVTAGRAASGLTAYDELERSLAVGNGLRQPDLPWRFGHDWRALYPAIVTRLGGEGLAADDWPAFRDLAAELERVAFGPAPINAAKLLALVDAGQVDLTCPAGRKPQADVLVEAVLPGPGVCGLPFSVVGTAWPRATPRDPALPLARAPVNPNCRSRLAPPHTMIGSGNGTVKTRRPTRSSQYSRANAAPPGCSLRCFAHG